MMNEVILLLAAALMVGAATYLGHQGLRLQRANKALKIVVRQLNANGGPTGSWDALCAAGDRLAHELSFKEHPHILGRWWDLRGGHDKCTVCADYARNTQAGKK